MLLDLSQLAAPGWLPLLLTLILGGLLALLWFSMRHHMGKIDVPVDPKRVESSRFAGPGE